MRSNNGEYQQLIHLYITYLYHKNIGKYLSTLIIYITIIIANKHLVYVILTLHNLIDAMCWAGASLIYIKYRYIIVTILHSTPTTSYDEVDHKCYVMGWTINII